MNVEKVIALLKEADKLERTLALLNTRGSEDTFSIGYGRETMEFVLTTDDMIFIGNNIEFRLGGIKAELQANGVTLK